MSSYTTYQDAPLRRRGDERDHRTRHWDREYVEEETRVQRNGDRQLIRRRRDTSVDSVDDVQRDLPVAAWSGGRRTRSAVRDRRYDDDFVEVRGTGYYAVRRLQRPCDDTCEWHHSVIPLTSTLMGPRRAPTTLLLVQ
jgi:hypothetical protein